MHASDREKRRSNACTGQLRIESPSWLNPSEFIRSSTRCELTPGLPMWCAGSVFCREPVGNCAESCFMAQPVIHFYEFGPFRLAPTERLLLRDDQPVPLGPKLFDILVVLV